MRVTQAVGAIPWQSASMREPATWAPTDGSLYCSSYPATNAPIATLGERASKARKCWPYRVLEKYATSVADLVLLELVDVPECVVNDSFNGPACRLSNCPVTVCCPPPPPPLMGEPVNMNVNTWAAAYKRRQLAHAVKQQGFLQRKLY